MCQLYSQHFIFVKLHSDFTETNVSIESLGQMGGIKEGGGGQSIVPIMFETDHDASSTLFPAPV